MSEKRKTIIFIGAVGCGKTTLCQRLSNQTKQYKKTQAIEVVGSAIDTPGEYIENRQYLKALVVTAVEADVVALVMDATRAEHYFSPHQADMFANQVIGVVTKVDVASQEECLRAVENLKLAGVKDIFYSPDPYMLLEKFLGDRIERREVDDQLRNN